LKFSSAFNFNLYVNDVGYNDCFEGGGKRGRREGKEGKGIQEYLGLRREEKKVLRRRYRD
jgi:hypothetical protein